MADFQCLAVDCPEGEAASLYQRIVVRQVENQRFFQQPVSYFLPPAIYSRLDTPVDYFYRPDTHQSVCQSSSLKNFIGLNRARRPHNAVFVSFTDASVPSECLEAAALNWRRVCVKEHDRKAEETLRQMFESRPIWSRNAVKANVNIHPDKLKLLLPVFAYYMVTGPWRSLWVRLGFDPRRDKDAKKYQMLDFRMRCSTSHGYSLSELPVKAKRSALNYNLPIVFNKAGPLPASVMELPSQDSPSTSRDPVPVSYQLKDSSYIFRDGMLPPHRQMFYQLCDLHVDSLQHLIEQSVPSEVCDERDGWCAVGTTDKLRDVISSLIKKIIRAQRPVLPELPRKRRRKGFHSNLEEEDKEQVEEGEEEEEEGEEFQLSEGSENEMETEILDYM